jgi:hypothetical protein
MYGLTTIKGLINHKGLKLMLPVFAALIFLSAVSLPAKAQVSNTYTGLTVVNAGTIGLVPGQMVLVSVPNFYYLDGSVRFVKHTIKVYERQSTEGLNHAVTERESGLVYSGESGGINEAFHIFTFRYADLPVQGEPLTRRAQLWIVVESFLPSATQAQAVERSADGLLPTFELVDEERGKTVLIGLLLPAIQK